MPRFSYAEIKAATTPSTNWSKFVVHPLADRLLWALANYAPGVHPNAMTFVAAILGVGAAACFTRGDSTGFALGAVLYFGSFSLDAIDGAHARLTDQRSHLGAWLDTLFDFVRSMLLAPSLALGAYRATGDTSAVTAGFAVMGVSAAYFYLAEVSQKLVGQRPAGLAHSSAHPIARCVRQLGLVPSPFGLADFDAVTYIIFPLLGWPVEGMILASVVGGITRVATAAVVLRHLHRMRTPAS